MNVRPKQDLLQRVLGPAPSRWRAVKAALAFAAFITIFVVAATSRREPDLSYVNVAILSGSAEANYHALVDRAAAEARRRHGRITNIASAGSVENIERLARAASSCDVQFALVQDGLSWPEKESLTLIARLPVPEALVIVGPHAEPIRSVADLRGLRIGIGPPGSGTEHVARQVIDQLADLDIHISAQSLQEQFAMLDRGELDLAAMVIDPDADLLLRAVRERKLQIVDIGSADALAHRLPSAREGVIKAGYYDPVRGVPPTDKHVINVDTLVIGNDCARESATQGVITALARVFPDLVRVNRERANLTGLEYATAAQSYFDDQGPDRLGQYAPWLIDIMPTARWLQLIFAFSMLFAAQALWHRFRLWRLDAQRVRIEEDIGAVFGPKVSPGEVAAAACRDPGRVDAIVADLEQLAARCRRHSLSMLVPMGQEMNYRYQESLILQWLDALRTCRKRLR